MLQVNYTILPDFRRKDLMVPMIKRTNSKNFEDVMRSKRRKKTRDPTKLEDTTDFITDENQVQVDYMAQNTSMISDDEYLDEDEIVVSI